MKKFYVYVDRLESGPSSGEVIYVGKGNDARIKCLDRNAKYNRKRLKYGVVRSIVLETEDERFAYDEEIRLIAEYHSYYKDPLATRNACNLRSGGEGGMDHHWTEERKKTLSESTRHAMNSMEDQSWKDRQKLAMKDPFVRQKISERTAAAMKIPEVYAKFKAKCKPNSGSFKKGHVVELEMKKKISERTKEAMKRPEIIARQKRPKSPETRAKISESLKAFNRRKESK